MEGIMAEYWDVYDENRELTDKTIKRGDPFGENEFYVCCEVWILNSNNQMLVTQRHPDKKAGGQWEFTGGGVLAGETTLLAASREVKEELGICLDEAEFELLEVYRHRNYFMDIYHFVFPFEEKDVTIEQSESINHKFASLDEIKELNDNSQFLHFKRLMTALENE